MPVRYNQSGTGSGTAVTNVDAKIAAGVVLTLVLSWIYRSVNVGVVVTQSPTTLVVPETTGIVVTTRVAAGTIKPSVIGGIVLTTTPTTPQVPLLIQDPGLKIVQHTFQLVRKNGGSSVINTASGWMSINNFLGLHDGVFSTFTGSATAAKSDTMVMQYVNPDSSKTQFTIVSVVINVYWKLASDTLSSTIESISCDSSGGLTSQVIQTGKPGNVDHTVTPQSLDITAAIGGSWAKLNGFEVKFNVQTPLGNISVTSADAAELVITTATLVTAQ